MFHNAIKQTTTTTGTGNLTLSAVAGFAEFSDWFPVNRPISYALLDSNGLFLEAGIGYLNGSGELVRARVQATLTSGVGDDTNPTAFSLTGTTTVICTAHSGTIQPAQANIDSVSSIGRFVGPANAVQTGVGASMMLNRCTYTPFHLRMGMTLASMGLQVTTAQAGGVIKIGLYAMSADGYIGPQIAVGAADIDASTTGFKSVSVANQIYLPPGDYFTATVASGSASAPAVACHNGTGTLLGGSSLGCITGTLSAVSARYETLSAGAALPAAPSASTTGGIAANTVAAPFVTLGSA